MSNKLLLILLALAWMALSIYGCDSTRSQSSDTLPQIGGTPSSNSDHNSQPEAPQDISGKPIWRGNSGGFEIVWTTEDLFSKSGERVERIFQPLAKKGYEEFVADLNRNAQTKGGQTQNCDYRRDFRLMSVVGPLAAFEDNEYTDCGGAHPTTELRFTLIDLRHEGEVRYRYNQEFLDVDLEKPGKVLKLAEYFNEADVLNALLADRLIKQALNHIGVSSPPQTLAALPEVFANDDYALNDSELVLRADFLTRFAFHHLEGDLVAMRLNLPSMAFAYRSRQIGLLLPIPSALRQPFALAAAGQEGFLMREAPMTIRNQFTRIAFKIGGGARHGNE